MFSKTDVLELLESLSADEDFLAARDAIQPGRFKRDESDPKYRTRVTYTKALRAFVYNPGLLNTILLDVALKEMFFRTFGYTGSMNFTMYPAVWLRDLPLLHFDDGVYLGDNIVLGTNQVSSDQRKLRVGPISIGAHTIFDQYCAIGLDTIVGANCQFGIHTAIGVKGRIGDGVRVREISKIGNCVRVGEGTRIGQDCTIHDFSIIEPGTEIPDGTRVPKYSIVTNDGVRSRK